MHNTLAAMRWSASFGVNRFLGFAAVLVSTSMLATAWSGQRKLPRTEAQSILNRYYDLLHKSKTIRIVEEARYGDQWMRSEIWLMKPFWRSVGSDRSGSEQRSYGNAKSVYSVDVTKKTYDIMERFPDSPFLNGFEPFNNRKRPKYTLGGKVRGPAGLQDRNGRAVSSGQHGLCPSGSQDTDAGWLGIRLAGAKRISFL